MWRLVITATTRFEHSRKSMLDNIVTASELPPVLHYPLHPVPRGGVLRAVQEGVRAEKGPGGGGGDGGGVPDHPGEELHRWWEWRARGVSHYVRVRVLD